MGLKSYNELIRIPSFKDRYNYLKMNGIVGDTTFGGRRYLNQILYKTPEWKKIKRQVMLRDDGFDLAHKDYPIYGNIYVHHINPITIEDILERRPCIFDLDNLISVSHRTHNAIHYGSEELLSKKPVERTKNDTCLWR